MSKITEIWTKICRKWNKIRLQPIRVYCLHHVCAVFDAESMNECDWMQIDEFKNKVLAMQQGGVEFISLTDAYQHLCKDWIRRKKYAVLTFDDGYASLKEILPWLEKKHIPVTLFINGKYLNGNSYRKNPKERYLTSKELFEFNNPFIEIAHHGWEHKRITEMTFDGFIDSVEHNKKILSTHPNYVFFWAYTYGTYNKKSDQYLREQHIVPVYVNGKRNISYSGYIDRELFKED